jgi:hypothetical protein
MKMIEGRKEGRTPFTAMPTGSPSYEERKEGRKE